MSTSDSDLRELSCKIAQLDRRFGTDESTRPTQVALAVLAAHADVDPSTLRMACRRSGSDRIAGFAQSKARWSQAVRLSQAFSSDILPPGAVGSAEVRDRAAVSSARKLVGHLLAPAPEGLTTKLGPITRHALAIAGERELHQARTKGWSSTLLTGPWLAAELGASSPQTGKKTLDRLNNIGWLTKGRRAAGAGRAHVYRLARLSKVESTDLWAEHGATVDALVLGRSGVNMLADLILGARQAAWAHGPEAPGSVVWVYAVEQASGARLGLSTRTRAGAREWMSSRALDLRGLIDWVSRRSGQGSLASIEKAAAEDARAAKSAELRALTDGHRAEVKRAGEHLRAIAFELCEHPGKRRSVAALVPGPEQGSEVAVQWLADMHAQLAERGVGEDLMPEIQKQLRAAFEAAGSATVVGDIDAQRARVEAARAHLVAAARSAVEAPGRRTTLAALVPPLDVGQKALRAWVLRLQYGLIVAAVDPTLLGQVGVQLERALVDAGYPEKASSGIPRGIVADLRRRGTDISQTVAA